MPRVSQEVAARNRARMVDAASRLLREGGAEAVTVAAVTDAVGLTQGGFYKQFESKEALVVEALELAVDERRERARVALGDAAAESFSSRSMVVESYLSTEHRDTPAQGCPVSALVTDAARHRDDDFGAAFSAAVNDLIDVMSDGVSRDQAIVDVTLMVGAVALARAVADPTLSEEILAAARRAIGRSGTATA